VKENVRGGSLILLQKALMSEIEKITDGMTFKQPGKEKRKKLQIYGQGLPIPEHSPAERDDETIDYVETDAEEAVFKCPWCIVRVEKGKIDGINADPNVVTSIEFGIFDDNTDNQGHEDVLNLIWKIYTRFAGDSLLEMQYECLNDFEFATQDEDTFPYFFGAMSMTFKFKGVQRESGAEFI
jgi:hypothetical protein